MAHEGRARLFGLGVAGGSNAFWDAATLKVAERPGRVFCADRQLTSSVICLLCEQVPHMRNDFTCMRRCCCHFASTVSRASLQDLCGLHTPADVTPFLAAGHRWH